MGFGPEIMMRSVTVDHRLQSSSPFRLTAAHAGFFILSQ